MKLGIEISCKKLKLTEYQPFKVGYLNKKYPKIKEIKVFHLISYKQFILMQVYLYIAFYDKNHLWQ